MDKISVIIPVYKVEQYIKRCLESIIQQKIDGFDLECILVNDCSPDDSMIIVREIVDNYIGNIQFILLDHNVNKGQSASRNTGLRNASGNFVFFMDSDDWISSNCLSLLYGVMLKCPNAQVVMGNMYHGKDDNTFLPESSIRIVLSSREAILERLYKMKIPPSACNKLVRRYILDDNRVFFQEGLLYEDMLWNYSLYQYVDVMIIINVTTYYYEDNPTSTVNTTVNKPNLVAHSFCYICKEMLSQLKPYLVTENLLYIYNVLLKAVFVSNQYSCNEGVISEIHQTQMQLSFITLKKGRLFLFLFFLGMFYPANLLFNLHFFRRLYHRSSMIICKTEKIFDTLFFRN